MDKNPLLEQPTGKPSMAPGFHSLTPKPTVLLFQLTLRPPFPLALFIPIQSSPSSTETSCQISHLCFPPFTTQQNLYKLTVSQNRTYSHYPFSLLPPLFHLLCFSGCFLLEWVATQIESTHFRVVFEIPRSKNTASFFRGFCGCVGVLIKVAILSVNGD